VSLRPTELAAVAASLSRELAGATVQRIGHPAPLRIELELRQPGKTTRLLLTAEPGLGRISVVDARTPARGPASPWLLRLRRELTGARLAEVGSTARAAELRFGRKGTSRTLVLELEPPGALLLLGEDGVPLAAAGEAARAPRPPAASSGEPSRLPPSGDGLLLARAAEALFAGRERALEEARVRRRAVQPLRALVERLRRTREKVRAEADRTGLADEHRRLGELLRAAGAVRRGAREATVTEYTASGQRTVVVPLEPGLDAPAQAERHFRLYRRLSRGSARAAARLEEVERALAEAESELSRAQRAPLAELPAPAPGGRRRAGKPAVHRPYRVFRAASGERILVGRAGPDNDALTFTVAGPNALWLHARGLPGAHVVVPLDRKKEISQETLLDAAHLALHHARGAGDRGEVSYTRIRHVRRVPGGAPGAVTYTHEKTFLLRSEPDRLERLLATREEE